MAGKGREGTIASRGLPTSCTRIGGGGRREGTADRTMGSREVAGKSKGGDNCPNCQSWTPAPISALPSAQPSALVSLACRYSDHRPYGKYTDDAQMTIALARSLVQQGR